MGNNVLGNNAIKAVQNSLVPAIKIVLLESVSKVFMEASKLFSKLAEQEGVRQADEKKGM